MPETVPHVSPTLSDEDLLLLLRDGEETISDHAWDELVGRYTNRLFVHLRRMGLDWADADAISNDTFLRIFQHIDTYKTRGKASSWIYRICTNAAYDHFDSDPSKKGKIQPLSENDDFISDEDAEDWVAQAIDHAGLSRSRFWDAFEAMKSRLPETIRPLFEEGPHRGQYRLYQRAEEQVREIFRGCYHENAG